MVETELEKRKCEEQRTIREVIWFLTGSLCLYLSWVSINAKSIWKVDWVEGAENKHVPSCQVCSLVSVMSANQNKCCNV